jgi:transcriptional regulator with XRE-family HTH domain
VATTIGGRIKAAREGKGLTQGELANKCGWGDNPVEAQSRISNYERNKREPTLADLRAISDILKVDPAELAFGHPLNPDPIEERIINDYRNATPQGKGFILDACESAQPERRPNGRKRKRLVT